MLDLEKMVKLRSDYKELCSNGLVSIQENYVHVALEWFLETFIDYEIRDFEFGNVFDCELVAIYKGVVFMSLATEEELKNRGLKA